MRSPSTLLARLLSAVLIAVVSPSFPGAAHAAESTSKSKKKRPVQRPSANSGGTAPVASPKAPPTELPMPPPPAATRPPPPAVPVAAQQSAQPPAAGAPRLQLGLRAGATVPLQLLGPGFEAGAIVRHSPQALGGRLGASLYVGVRRSSGQAMRLVPGRGLDVAFTQTALTVPVEVSADYAVWSTPAHAVRFGVGASLLWQRSTFVAFSATSVEEGLGAEVLSEVRYALRAGPGALEVALRFGLGGVTLGTLGSVGSQSTTAGALSVAYLFGI